MLQFLDTLSGGLISNVLRNKSDSYQPTIKNLNDDILIIVDESLNPNQNNVIEIRDGQDDGIEVIEFHQIKFMKKYITKLIILFFIFEVCRSIPKKLTI